MNGVSAGLVVAGLFAGLAANYGGTWTGLAAAAAVTWAAAAVTVLARWLHRELTGRQGRDRHRPPVPAAIVRRLRAVLARAEWTGEDAEWLDSLQVVLERQEPGWRD